MIERGSPPDPSVRTRLDCLRAAVSVALDVPYEETPHDRDKRSPYDRRSLEQAGWGAWAYERGLRWCWSRDLAPVFLPTWFACVHGHRQDRARRLSGLPVKPARKNVIHALLMEHRRLIYDPSGRTTAVHPSQIVQALWLVPVDSPGRGRGNFWRISRSPDPQVYRQAPDYTPAAAAAAAA